MFKVNKNYCGTVFQAEVIYEWVFCPVHTFIRTGLTAAFSQTEVVFHKRDFSQNRVFHKRSWLDITSGRPHSFKNLEVGVTTAFNVVWSIPAKFPWTIYSKQLDPWEVWFWLRRHREISWEEGGGDAATPPPKKIGGGGELICLSFLGFMTNFQ